MSWRCFHCEEEFTDAAAAGAHFGPDPASIPGCVIKLTGGDLGLLARLRLLEHDYNVLRQDIEDETTSTRAYRERLLGQIHSYRVFRECQSVQDVFNLFDSMEGRALAAEERATAAEQQRDTLAAENSARSWVHGTD